MIRLRVSKYDPARRDKLGRYLIDEWTSVTEIGKEFEGTMLTVAEYLATENSYVAAARQLLSCVEVERLRVESLEQTECENRTFLEIPAPRSSN